MSYARAPRRLTGAAVGLALFALGGPAAAQILPGGLPGGLPALPAAPLGSALGPLLGQSLGQVESLPAGAERLARMRLERLRALVRGNPQALDFGEHGEAVVRGAALAISPTAAALARAQRAGFTVTRRSALTGLGLELVTLQAPAGMTTREAVRRLRRLDPAGRYDFDHLYEPSGAAAAAGEPAAPAEPAAHARIGMIDGGVASGLAVFAKARLQARGFAPGAPAPSDHGTEVAALLAGDGGGFEGVAPGAQLLAADVYGRGPTGGSAEAIVLALGWLAGMKAPVINISLTGPPNLAVAAAVRAVLARGALIVAPVGNDGPAAPLAFPASYPGVIAVTPVDPRGRPLPEAGRASHLDFAAQGAGLALPNAGGVSTKVRGASFAAPIVSGELALLLPTADPARARAAVTLLANRARKGGPARYGIVNLPR
ncbi:MAG TPA: S8 family serine peptidase [Caulobacteraceae bacterium]|nr:S8 family serine peptidase [Caulobacteraceae bacterium]